MRATRIIANLRVPDVEAAKNFYTDFLGLSTEEFNMGWVARYTNPDTRANVQLVTRDATAPEDSVISVHTDDIEAAYEDAHNLGFEIVHPITTEPWGVRRFFVRAPDGNVINIVNHRDLAHTALADLVGEPVRPRRDADLVGPAAEGSSPCHPREQQKCVPTITRARSR
jgi:predicted enzyme related to lactoylglutathione lyase